MNRTACRSVCTAACFLLLAAVFAGLLLVEEAGGRATDFVADYGLLGKGGVIAATPALVPQLEALSGLRVA